MHSKHLLQLTSMPFQRSIRPPWVAVLSYLAEMHQRQDCQNGLLICCSQLQSYVRDSDTLQSEIIHQLKVRILYIPLTLRICIPRYLSRMLSIQCTGFSIEYNIPYWIQYLLISMVEVTPRTCNRHAGSAYHSNAVS